MAGVIHPGSDFQRPFVVQPETPRFDADSGLRVNVVFTERAGTLVALREALRLAKGLSTRISLHFLQIVPYPLPIGSPPVELGHTNRMLLDLAVESGVATQEIYIQVCLCRDQRQCLRQVLSPSSLVVLGGRRRWRWSLLRKLERTLRLMGHDVILVGEKEGSWCLTCSMS